MTRYSVQLRNRIFVKGFRFLSFAKSMGKNNSKNISKILSGIYSPGMLAMRKKLLDHAKKSATDAFKIASKGAIQKTAEATGDWIGNNIVNVVAKSYDGKIATVSKNSQQNNSETVTNEYDKEIPKERYISSDQKRQEIIDELRLK